MIRECLLIAAKVPTTPLEGMRMIVEFFTKLDMQAAAQVITPATIIS